MNEILQDLSPAALSRAVEENGAAIIQDLDRWPQAEVYDGADIKWSITGIRFALFNNVFLARLAPHQVDTAIRSATTRASVRQVPLLWWVGPQTRPDGLPEQLEAHGFVRTAREPGMALDLMRLDEGQPMTPGLSVRAVDSNGMLTEWCQACIRGFKMPGFAAEAFTDFMHHVDMSLSRPYLGWLNGQPVATSLVCLAAGVAGIYSVTTLPEARRQGIGAWMTRIPLQEARARGYRAGILQSSAMGTSVYRRLGFQECCRIDQYLWSPPPAHESAG